jgi:hypothetical protein
VQQPVCIVLAARDESTTADQPARVRFRSLPKGHRTDKFTALGAVTLADEGWLNCPDDWRAPFLPPGGDQWSSFPSLDDLLRYSGSGTMPGRTWVIAPDQETLRQRWHALTTAKPADTVCTDRRLAHEHRRGAGGRGTGDWVREPAGQG